MTPEEQNTTLHLNRNLRNEVFLEDQEDVAKCVSSKWAVLGASVQGLSHEQSDKPCQDHHYWMALPHDALVVAVADGTGSAKLAEVGALIASQTAVKSVAQQITLLELPKTEDSWRTLLSNSLKAARTAIEQEATTRNTNLNDLATTLILIVATEGTIAAAQIGDGASVISDENGTIHALTTPEHGEYINTATFIVSHNALETAQINIWHGQVTQIAAFSDGLERIALEFPAITPFTPFFAPLFNLVGAVTDDDSRLAAQQQLATFLLSPRVRERADDDLTLLLASRGASSNFAQASGTKSAEVMLLERTWAGSSGQ